MYATASLVSLSLVASVTKGTFQYPEVNVDLFLMASLSKRSFKDSTSLSSHMVLASRGVMTPPPILYWTSPITPRSFLGGSKQVS